MKKKIVPLIGLVVVCAACGREDVPVSRDEASQLAQGFQQAPVNDVVSIPDKDGQVAVHIVRFANGGFMILSADRRMPPVLAYSDKSSFPMGPDVVGPSGVDAWLAGHIQHIEQIRAAPHAVEAPIQELWDTLAVRRAVAPAAHPVGERTWTCTPTHHAVAPLLTTTWNQGCGYNLDAPNLGCGGAGQCGHAWTGCEATAAAQVMRFHHYPSQYDWAVMPSSTWCETGNCLSPLDYPAGTAQIAGLMRDIGNDARMSYGCSGSSAQTTDVQSALVNKFGYAATYASYDFFTVMDEVNAGRPVIHDGFGQSCALFVCWPVNGHAWVSDGYDSSTVCDDATQIEWWFNYLHMNWGWGGAYDGMFLDGRFNPAGEDFTHYDHIVYGIQPR